MLLANKLRKKIGDKTELKTEEGNSAEILSAQCPHNISLVRHISFVRCFADKYLQGYKKLFQVKEVS